MHLVGQHAELIAKKVRRAFGAKVILTSLIPLAGDASSRRYCRALLDGTNAPASMIVMEFSTGSALPLSSEELAVFKEPLTELPFINVYRFLHSVGVRVPLLYGQWEKEGVLFLEDLGDVALWDKVQGLDEVAALAWYRKAVNELLRLQINGMRQRDDRCIAFQQRFDFRLYMWEFEHFLEYGLEKRPETKVTQTTMATLRKHFSDIAQRLDRQAPCLSHRDYHSWNLMIHNEQVVVIDFQDALLAPAQYDLASLLNDRITDSVIHPQLEDQLLRFYIDQKTAMATVSIDRDEFFEIYLLSTIQRDLKVVGRFYYLDLVKGKPAYLKFIPPTLRRLKRNLARIDQTKDMVPLLADHFAEMR